MLVLRAAGLSIHRLLLNEIKTNCYLIERDGEALLVDPTDQGDKIAAYVQEQGWKLRFMMTTHGHFDHVGGAAAVIAAGLAERLYVDERDFPEVKRTSSYGLMILKRKLTVPVAAAYSPELLALLDDWGLALAHAGGHTPGSCYLYAKDKSFVITGDLVLHHKLSITLFNSRENAAELLAFIDTAEKLFPPETVVLPGHGDPTTMAAESAKNPKWHYLREKHAAAQEGST